MTVGLVLGADWHYMWACSVYPAFVAVTLVLGELTGCRVKPQISCQQLSIGKQQGPRHPLHSIINDALRGSLGKSPRICCFDVWDFQDEIQRSQYSWEWSDFVPVFPAVTTKQSHSHSFPAGYTYDLSTTHTEGYWATHRQRHRSRSSKPAESRVHLRKGNGY